MSWGQAQHSLWERATKKRENPVIGDLVFAFSCSLPGDEFSIFVVLLTGHSRCLRVRGGSTTGELNQLMSELSGVPEQLFYNTACGVRLQGPHHHLS